MQAQLPADGAEEDTPGGRVGVEWALDDGQDQVHPRGWNARMRFTRKAVNERWQQLGRFRFGHDGTQLLYHGENVIEQNHLQSKFE